MKKSEVFPSKWMKVDDLGGQDTVAVISSVERETVGDDVKSVAYFKGGKLKPLVLNKTNYESIEEISGQEDDDNWGGTKIVLFESRVRFNSKLTPCVRIKAPSNDALSKSASAVPAQTSLDGVEAAF